ncbi:sugar phosphate isomerase/epimerase family protein [Kolteria novifilia]|uniref:sugar phosphate isomerase/epimerase family protein n=1 Tax=Kolteria novifilia TaxID=2527975 RepID=UPI003AF39119
MKRLSVRLEAFQLPLTKALSKAGSLGLGGVEFDAAGELSPEELSQTGRRHLRHAIRSQELNFTGIGFLSRHGFEEIDRLERRVSQAVKVLALAAELGAPVVVGQLGTIPTDDDSPAALAFHDAVTRLAREAERLGTRYAASIGPNQPSELADLFAKTGGFGLAVAYDPALLLVRGEDAYGGVRTLHDHLASIRLKDAVRSGIAVSGYREVPLGEGEVDWESFLGALEEVNYQGSLTLAPDQQGGGPDAVAASAAFVQRLI